MAGTIVDSNVLLDVLTEDPVWFEWSADALASAADVGVVGINPIIYSEISVRFERIEDLEEAVPRRFFDRLPLPWEAGFLAGKCFLEYRRRSRRAAVARSPLPDFYIGAHAAIAGMTLLTRDAARYRTYFPALTLITP